MENQSYFQNPVIGFAMEKQVTAGNKLTHKGRPKINVVFAVLLRLREGQGLGWDRLAKEYRAVTGIFTSGETLKRRYLLYKARQSAGK